MSATAIDPLNQPGIAVDAEALIALRHLSRRQHGAKVSPTNLPGGFVSRKRGRGLETAEIRLYTHGDDIRHIDRNTTARTGQLHVRTFQDERDRTAILCADFRSDMLWGTKRAFRSVAAAEALCLIGWRVVEAGGRVGLIAFGGGEPVLVPARGRERGMVNVIGGLAQAHRDALQAAATGAQPMVTLDETLEMAARVSPSGASVYLATGLDKPGPEFTAMASALNHRADLNVLLVTDAFETSAPSGNYLFEDDNGRHSATLNTRTVEPAGVKRMERLGKIGIPSVALDASKPPAEMIGMLEVFDERGR